MDQTLLASRVGRIFAAAAARLVPLLFVAGILGVSVASPIPARGATLDSMLRFMPSPSSDVAGYVVHVGGQPGFFANGSGSAVDIGMHYALVDGVGEVPLGTLTGSSAYLVMQAYDSAGQYSPASNEIYVDIVTGPAPGACASDLDCADGDACNGVEQCVSGACTAGTPLACDDPDPCRVGWCDATSGCASGPVADGTVCDDGDPGTGGDVCQAGSCIGAVLSPEEPSSGGTVLLYDDFEDLLPGTTPADWEVVDYRGTPQPGAFVAVTTEDGGRAFAVPRSPGTRYLAHYMGPGAETWSSYELIGRMRADDTRSGIGVMIASAYPAGSEHVSLLRNGAQPSFVLGIDPADSPLVCVGGTDTGFAPQPGAWTVFRVRAIPETDGLRLQAKVWDEADAEPAGWQVDCVAQGRQAVTGRPGLIAGGPGAKYFDDLGVWAVTTSSTGGGSTGDGSTDDGATDDGPAAPLYTDDFEAWAPGTTPADWEAVDYRGTPQPGAFVAVTTEDGGRAFAVPQSPGTRYLAHYMGPGAETWSSYELIGRMRADDTRSGIGVMIASAYPAGSEHVSLLRNGAQPSYVLDIHPADSPLVCAGGTDTGFAPQPGAWTVFRVRAIPEIDGLRLQAKVWDEADAEPAGWQVDCVAQGRQAVTGRPGLIAGGPGAKFFDDLGVWAVTTSSTD